MREIHEYLCERFPNALPPVEYKYDDCYDDGTMETAIMLRGAWGITHVVYRPDAVQVRWYDSDCGCPDLGVDIDIDTDDLKEQVAAAVAKSPLVRVTGVATEDAEAAHRWFVERYKQDGDFVRLFDRLDKSFAETSATYSHLKRGSMKVEVRYYVDHVLIHGPLGYRKVDCRIADIDFFEQLGPVLDAYLEAAEGVAWESEGWAPEDDDE